MNTAATAQMRPTAFNPDRALKASAMLWFAVALVGQSLFVAYIAIFYGGSTIAGDFERIDGRVFHGFIAGDVLGNALFMGHVLLAFSITFGGPLQLIPQVRNRFRTFHRWNGRIYIATAFIISLGALILVYTRGVIGGPGMIAANTLNAALIMGFAFMTIRKAMARDFRSHERWAVRMFLAVSGVWFFRLGFGFYAFVTGGEMPGSQNDLEGPFDLSLAFAYSLVPLFVLELYYRARDTGGPLAKSAMAGGMLGLTAATGMGIFMAAQIFWLPNM